MASSGDAIKIGPGTYVENLTISVSLKLLGAGATKTIINGGNVTRVVSILSTTVNVAISGVTIEKGSAVGGGGILNWGRLILNNSAVVNNYAASSFANGGGIYNSGTLTVNNCTFSGNTGSATFMYGGAIYNDGTLAINNSTLTGNSATAITGGGGGAIYNGGTVKISSSTISGNSATPSGGGIYNSGTANVQNSIIADSPSGGNCFGTVTSHGYNLSSDNSCNFKSVGDLNNTDPLLGPLQSNGGQTQTMGLTTGSPAIDGGNPAGCTNNVGKPLKTDQRGQPRPDATESTGCDIGAYENQTS